MARLFFLLLLIANVAFGVHIYLQETAPRASLPAEILPESIKIVSVTDPAKAQQEALAARLLAATLSASACIEFAVKASDDARAQDSMATMNLGSRVASRNVEEFSRYALTLPPQTDKRAADALVANLKKFGVNDVSALNDNGISLGVFSTEDAALRLVADLKSKAPSLMTALQVTPRSPQPKETVFTVREPDTNIVAKLTLKQREFDGSHLRAVTCPTAPPNGDPPGGSAAKP